jgi:sugar (pentulose or hexulose) kinase
MSQSHPEPPGDRPVTVLGIDLGTSSIKAVVARLDGTVAGQATGDYEVVSPLPGWSESAPADWLAATATAVRTAVAATGADPVAIGLSGQMHGRTTDPAWRQMLADILGRDLAPVEVPAASGLGAALLGARAADLTDQPAFTPGTAAVRVETAARAADRDLYDERHHAFRRKVHALRDTDNDTVGIAGSALRSVASASG